MNSHPQRLYTARLPDALDVNTVLHNQTKNSAERPPLKPRLCLIAAMAANRVIGAGNKMPWHLPADLQHFKQLTLGKPVLMGRKTFESIGCKPLPGRVNIVITRNKNFAANGALLAGDLHSALALAEQHALDEIMIMGGANIYEQALPLADRLYLTFIQLNTPGDAFFPDISAFRWNEIASKSFTPDEKNPYNYSFVTLERVATSMREINPAPVKNGGLSLAD